MTGTKTNAGNFFEDFRFGQIIKHATPKTGTNMNNRLQNFPTANLPAI